MREWNYCPTFFTPALDAGEWPASLSRPLYPWRSSRHPWERRLTGPWNRSGHCDNEKTIILPCRESNSRRPISSPSLYRLSYPGSLDLIVKQNKRSGMPSVPTASIYQLQSKRYSWQNCQGAESWGSYSRFWSISLGAYSRRFAWVCSHTTDTISFICN
jgi:hypothetical protein